MQQDKKYNPDKGESLKTQFSRFAARVKHRWNGQPVGLDDINTIKLPAVSVGAYYFGIEPSYFATRNEGNKWNIEAKTSYGGEYQTIDRVATDLDLPAALDFLAQKNPRSMMFDTGKYWHPVSVAKLIGHEFPTGQNAKPAAKAPEMSA